MSIPPSPLFTISSSMAFSYTNSSSLSEMLPVGIMSMFERAISGGGQHKRKVIAWVLAVSLAVALSVALSLRTTKHASQELKPLDTVSRAAATTTESGVVSACMSTRYPDACEAALASLATRAGAKGPKEMFHVSVEFAKSRALLARDMAYNLTLPSAQTSTSRSPSSVHDCLELLDITLDQLNDVLEAKKGGSSHDARTWLSAALTNQATCSESLQAVKAEGGDSLSARVRSLSQHISNSLALQGKVQDDDGVGGGRKLLSDGFPAWLSAADRRLLEASPDEIRANAVVAKDGSGTHTTINEAIAFVSLASSGGGGRKVIYVKAGTYDEYINVPTKQKNVMLMGDGKGKSVIVGSRNANDGWTTYKSATVGTHAPPYPCVL